MSIADFFRKRQALLVIIGWLIIVLTFITKDVLRDNVKDLADSINAAETLYLLRDENLELHQEIDEVDAHLIKAEINILAFQGKAAKAERDNRISSASFHRDSDRVLRAWSETYLELDNLGRLVTIAPPDQEHMKQFTGLAQEWDTLMMKILKEEGAQAQVPIDKFDAKASDLQSNKDYTDILILGGRLRLVGADVIDEAHQTKVRKERLISIFTPISYVLWGLGAILTLASKLFGDSKAVIEE